jgi:hypothetical protein
MPAPALLPNGRLDRIKAGEKSITIQTEFFPEPTWRAESKVYVDGALRKLEKLDLAECPEAELQKRVDRFHEETTGALAGKLRAQQEKKG